MTGLWILGCIVVAWISFIAGKLVEEHKKPPVFNINIYNVFPDDFEGVETPERTPQNDPIFSWN